MHINKTQSHAFVKPSIASALSLLGVISIFGALALVFAALSSGHGDLATALAPASSGLMLFAFAELITQTARGTYEASQSRELLRQIAEYTRPSAKTE